MKNITIIGAGYVGLVTGACFATKNNNVTIVEHDQKKIEKLLHGKIPFYEPGLGELVKQGIEKKTLHFTHNIKDALATKSELIFSCVGTPPKADGSADLSFVYTVAEQIGECINDYTIVVNKSTVPVGTAITVKEIIEKTLKHRALSLSFDVVSNPEFLKEGDALNDFLNPDRVVIGTHSTRAEKILYELYKPFLQSKEQFITMNIPSAELTKYASNAMLATRISFMNQLALLADSLGADIAAIKRGMGSDRRIGRAFLNAGIGYGGSCFPKDVTALAATGRSYNHTMTLVEEVDRVNKEQTEHFINKILDHYGPNICNKTIGLWGLSFKPETDDIRSAPSITIIEKLLAAGATLITYDPEATENIKQIFGDKISYATTKENVLTHADCLLVLTEWKTFTTVNPEIFKILKDKLVFDGRNCFEPANMHKHGITYSCIGRNSVAKNLINPSYVTMFDEKKENTLHSSR